MLGVVVGVTITKVLVHVIEYGPGFGLIVKLQGGCALSDKPMMIANKIYSFFIFKCIITNLQNPFKNHNNTYQKWCQTLFLDRGLRLIDEVSHNLDGLLLDCPNNIKILK